MGLYVAAAVVLAVIGFLVWWRWDAKSAGTDKVRAEVAEKTADVLKRQGEAVVNAPVGKEAVVNRLREKGL